MQDSIRALLYFSPNRAVGRRGISVPRRRYIPSIRAFTTSAPSSPPRPRSLRTYTRTCCLTTVTKRYGGGGTDVTRPYIGTLPHRTRSRSEVPPPPTLRRCVRIARELYHVFSYRVRFLLLRAKTRAHCTYIIIYVLYFSTPLSSAAVCTVLYTQYVAMNTFLSSCVRARTRILPARRTTLLWTRVNTLLLCFFFHFFLLILSLLFDVVGLITLSSFHRSRRRRRRRLQYYSVRAAVNGLGLTHNRTQHAARRGGRKRGEIFYIILYTRRRPPKCIKREMYGGGERRRPESDGGEEKNGVRERERERGEETVYGGRCGVRACAYVVRGAARVKGRCPVIDLCAAASRTRCNQFGMCTRTHAVRATNGRTVGRTEGLAGRSVAEGVRAIAPCGGGRNECVPITIFRRLIYLLYFIELCFLFFISVLFFLQPRCLAPNTCDRTTYVEYTVNSGNTAGYWNIWCGSGVVVIFNGLLNS